MGANVKGWKRKRKKKKIIFFLLLVCRTRQSIIGVGYSGDSIFFLWIYLLYCTIYININRPIAITIPLEHSIQFYPFIYSFHSNSNSIPFNSIQPFIWPVLCVNLNYYYYYYYLLFVSILAACSLFYYFSISPFPTFPPHLPLAHRNGLSVWVVFTIFIYSTFI